MTDQTIVLFRQTVQEMVEFLDTIIDFCLVVKDDQDPTQYCLHCNMEQPAIENEETDEVLQLHDDHCIVIQAANLRTVLADQAKKQCTSTGALDDSPSFTCSKCDAPISYSGNPINPTDHTSLCYDCAIEVAD